MLKLTALIYQVINWIKTLKAFFKSKKNEIIGLGQMELGFKGLNLKR